jgi:hypothetical protein
MADVTKEIVLEVGLKDSTAAGTTSAKTRLRELQKTLADMALAGQDGTKAFREMEKEAGRLKDQIGDTQQRIKNLASDTRTIDTFVGAIQGITAGFQIAQGAAALFGDENEDLQKAMLKVQGAMALANGVQQVANLLNKDSILITQGQAAAQRLYAFTLGQSTVALRLFRTALVATGIGAAAVAIGLLVENWSKLVKVVKDFLGIETKDLNALAENAQRQLELAEARGESEKKLQQLLMASYDARIKAADDEEEKAQLMHEKEVARIQYETKLRTDSAAKRKEINATLKELDEQAKKSEKDLLQFRNESITDPAEKEKALNRERFNQLMEERDKKVKLLHKELGDTKDFLEGKKDIEEYYNNLNQQQSAESAKRLEEIERNRRQKELQMASQAVAALGDLLTAGLGQSEKDQRKAFEINKKSSIAQALINTYQAVTAALTAGGNPIKLATGAQFIDAGIALAAGLANVVKISKTQFQGSGGGGGGSMSLPSGGGTSSTPAPVFANPQTTMLGTDGAALNGQGQGVQPMRAYVVERDIQQTTSRVRRLSEFATLG